MPLSSEWLLLADLGALTGFQRTVDLAGPQAIDALAAISNGVSAGLVVLTAGLSTRVRPVVGTFRRAFGKFQACTGITAVDVRGVIGNATAAAAHAQ